MGARSWTIGAHRPSDERARPPTEVDRLGPVEIGIALVLVLVLFGAGRLPEAFTQLGKAVRNMRGPPGGLGPRVSTGTRTHENGRD